MTTTAPLAPPMVPVQFAFALDPASHADISHAQLAAALPNLLTQQNRDVGVVHNLAPCLIDATIYTAAVDVPSAPGVVVVVLTPTLPEKGAAGYHDETGNGHTPCVYVSTAGQSVDDITVTISHELTEERYDPFCNGFSLGVGKVQVNIAQELSDQCEDVSYRVGNTLVSDFCLPANFDPQTEPGTPVTFCNSLHDAGARTKGGYIIFADGTTDPPMDALPAHKTHWNSRLMRRLNTMAG